VKSKALRPILAHPHRRSAAHKPRRESILDEDKLPLRFTACTPCFRAEAGAAGRARAAYPPAPVHQGGTRLDYDSRAKQGRA